MFESAQGDAALQARCPVKGCVGGNTLLRQLGIIHYAAQSARENPPQQ